MALSKFPVGLSLHPNEVSKIDPISQREERWVPSEHEGDFQQWRRYTLQRDAELSERGALTVLPVRLQDCIADFRGKLKRLFGGGYKGETYGELSAPIGEGGSLIEVQTLMPRAREVLLAWAREAGVDLNDELIQEFFPESEGFEVLGAEKVKYLVMTGKVKAEEKKRETLGPNGDVWQGESSSRRARWAGVLDVPELPKTFPPRVVSNEEFKQMMLCPPAAEEYRERVASSPDFCHSSPLKYAVA